MRVKSNRGECRSLVLGHRSKIRVAMASVSKIRAYRVTVSVYCVGDTKSRRECQNLPAACPSFCFLAGFSVSAWWAGALSIFIYWWPANKEKSRKIKKGIKWAQMSRIPENTNSSKTWFFKNIRPMFSKIRHFFKSGGVIFGDFKIDVSLRGIFKI